MKIQVKKGEQTLTPKQLNVLIPTALAKELGRYCINHDTKKKEVVEKALQEFLARQPQGK